MKIKKGRYLTRGGTIIEIEGVSMGWAYTRARQWFYADTGESVIRVKGWFGAERDIIGVCHD